MLRAHLRAEDKVRLSCERLRRRRPVALDRAHGARRRGVVAERGGGEAAHLWGHRAGVGS